MVVLGLLDALATLPYLGEAIDQRAHALQAAGLANAAGADDEVVAAALLHDIARAPEIHRVFPGPHAQAGALWCRQRFSSRVAAMVGGHVAAKRWLVTTDAAYASGLTPASVLSLSRQGGPLSPAEVTAFDGQPWADEIIAVRRWDDRAKVPGAPEPALDLIADVVRRAAKAARASHPATPAW
jgi:predicted HD phosphohydrolase